MVARNYLLKSNGMSFYETYEKFNKEYSKNLIISIRTIKNEDLNIYEMNEVAVILNKTQNKESLKFFKNIDLIGKEKNINKTIQEIQNKGFKLEGIIK